jgi:CTP synthase
VNAVIPLVTAETIYEVPLLLEDSGLTNFIIDKLRLTSAEADLNEWRDLVGRLKLPKEPVTIALVGKYVELQDAYYSVREALCHAGLYHNKQIQVKWIHSEDLECESGGNLLKTAQGIIVPGGFGYRGIEGMINAARYARENNIPYLGLCLGMQVMVIEFGRYALKSKLANSSEFDPDTPYPVIDYMPNQVNISAMGGTMRLGAYPCRLVYGTHASRAYAQDTVYERHRHRFEFNNRFREQFEQKGLIASGLSLDNRLVEITELKDHPWMVASQFHAEFRSRPNRAHPLFIKFIEAAKETMVDGTQVTMPF